MPTMLTIRQAAEKSGVAYSTIRRWILSGEFKGFKKSGTKFLINEDLFINFLFRGEENEA